MKSKVCLVVSSDIKTWGVDGEKIAFVQDTVPDYSQADKLDEYDSIFIEGSWDTSEYRKKNKEFVKERVDQYRHDLYKLISEKLDLNVTEQGWRILFDAWAFHFVSIVYDRVNHLKNAKDQIHNSYIISNKQYEFDIKTVNDFIGLCLNDNFNQYLYCEAAKILDINVVENNNCYIKNENKIIRSIGLLTKVKQVIFSGISIIIRLWIRYTKPLLIIDGYFPYWESLLIILRSFGKVLVLPKIFILPPFGELKVDHKLRKGLKVSENDEYDKFSNHILKQCFPVTIFEGLNAYIEKVKDISYVPAIGSAIGFYSDDGYKILSASVLINSGKTIGFQHGGTYNVFDFYINNLSIAASDKYYFWNSRSLGGNLLPPTKLEKIKKYKTKINNSINTEILFISTIFSKYPKLRYKPFCQKTRLFNRQLVFYDGLNNFVKSKFIVRPNPTDLGWRYMQRWKDYTNNSIEFDSELKLYKSLITKKIVVTDHLSTTWIEVLYIDIPIVIYFDYSEYDLVIELKEIFIRLESVSVIHRTPESASAFLNSNYDIIEKWWRDEEVAVVVNELRDYFFNQTDMFVTKWTSELLLVRDSILKKQVAI